MFAIGKKKADELAFPGTQFEFKKELDFIEEVYPATNCLFVFASEPTSGALYTDLIGQLQETLAVNMDEKTLSLRFPECLNYAENQTQIMPMAMHHRSSTHK